MIGIALKRVFLNVAFFTSFILVTIQVTAVSFLAVATTNYVITDCFTEITEIYSTHKSTY